MPYIGKWMPAMDAIAHVMKVESCDNQAAMVQMAAAIRDQRLRNLRLGSNWRMWTTSGEVYRADLLKLWPSIPEHVTDSAGALVTALPQHASSESPEPLLDGEAPVSDHHQPAKPKKPRVEKGIWRLARDEAFNYLEYEGTPQETGDQAKLEKHIAEYLGRKYSKHPAPSTIRKHVREWIDERTGRLSD
jgi:hypothetical protein